MNQLAARRNAIVPKLTQETLAGLAETSRVQISRLETGERGLTVEWAKRLAPHLGVTPPQILFSDEELAAACRRIPVIGYVGAGQEIYPVDAGMLDTIDWPMAPPPGTAAVIVRGASWFPVYREGDALLAHEWRPPAELINRRAIVELEDERRLVKEIRRGSAPGLWRLTSFNAPQDIEDVRIVRAAPIAWVRPDW